MPGFSLFINLNKDAEKFSQKIDFKGKKTFFQNAQVLFLSNGKFDKDKLFAEDEDLFITINGIIFLIEDKYVDINDTDLFENVKALYIRLGTNFCNKIKGDYSILLFDKKNKKWLCFANQIGIKPVYFYKLEDLIILSSELKIITKIVSDLNFTIQLDELAAYFLLTYGFMLEDHTVVRDIKKLKPGNFIEINESQLTVGKYHNFIIETKKQSTIDAIEVLDNIFVNAVKNEFSKDLDYGYKHIATLSGGLDTRMDIVVAHEQKYINFLDVTFSQNGYYDEKISKKIASDLGHEHLFYSLDNGNYLKDIEGPICANDGMVIYSGSAHMLSCISKINYDKYGLIHTGMLGDAVLGTYLSKPAHTKPDSRNGAYSKKLLYKIEAEVKKYLVRYETEELFKLYNRGFNGILNGNWTISHFTESSSPFLDKDFIEYSLNIPPEMKYNQRLYIDWIKTKHPIVAKYIWEKTKLKPSKNELLPKILKYLRCAGILILNRHDKRSMNPFQYWYDNNNLLKETLDEYFNKNIWLLGNYKQLQKDSINLYNSGTMLEKTQVLTLLEAIKLHHIT